MWSGIAEKQLIDLYMDIGEFWWYIEITIYGFTYVLHLLPN